MEGDGEANPGSVQVSLLVGIEQQAFIKKCIQQRASQNASSSAMIVAESFTVSSTEVSGASLTWLSLWRWHSTDAPVSTGAGQAYLAD